MAVWDWESILVLVAELVDLHDKKKTDKKLITIIFFIPNKLKFVGYKDTALFESKLQINSISL